jgi:hypothetical protein
LGSLFILVPIVSTASWYLETIRGELWMVPGYLLLFSTAPLPSSIGLTSPFLAPDDLLESAICFLQLMLENFEFLHQDV